jgi:hypothetical protein
MLTLPAASARRYRPLVPLGTKMGSMPVNDAAISMAAGSFNSVVPDRRV